jgi:hypothetical protein
MLKNWRTTSAGLTMIIGATIHLIFAVRAHTADENTWTTSLLAVAGGMGLIFAGDGATSATKEEAGAVNAKVDLVTSAIQTGDTSMLVKPPVVPSLTQAAAVTPSQPEPNSLFNKP